MFEIEQSGNLSVINEMGYEADQGGIRSIDRGMRSSKTDHLNSVETDYWSILYNDIEKSEQNK